MKKLLLLSFVVGLVPLLAQISLQTNLPPGIAPGNTINFEVKISKGSISSFSKYQVDVPAGITISEGESKTGNFTFEDQRAKLVWVNLPPQSEFVVSFKMAVGSLSGPVTLVQKFYYVDEGGKKEYEAEPLTVQIDPSGATTTTSFPGVSANVAANNSSSGSSGNNAGTSGSQSGGSASENAANTVPANTSSGSDNTSQNTNTVAAGGGSENTAQSTTTAGTSGGSDSGAQTKTANAGETQTTVAGTSGNSSETVTNNTAGTDNSAAKDAATNAKTGSGAGTSETKTVKPAETGGGEAKGASGLVFRLQLGAYGMDPGKGRFSKAGNVTISKEDGLYKVLHGSFKTKEEALKKMEDIKAKGLDCFIVRYQNGQRVK